MKVDTSILLKHASHVMIGVSHEPIGTKRSFQASGRVESDSGSATVTIDFSNDSQSWMTGGTITLDLSTESISDGFISDASWRYVRASITQISGDQPSVDVVMGGFN